MPRNDQALLTRLKDSGLDFVVIGGVCVVFHGAPIAPFDLDICCPFGQDNLEKIESAVRDLHPVHRLTANKLPLELTRSAFGELNNLYPQTDCVETGRRPRPGFARRPFAACDQGKNRMKTERRFRNLGFYA